MTKNLETLSPRKKKKYMGDMIAVLKYALYYHEKGK